MTTIKSILKTQIKKLENPILSFRITHEAEVRNSKIIAAFSGDLGASIPAQKGIPLNYGSEFRDSADLTKLFFYNEDRVNIINIIQQDFCYHLDPIGEETRK